MNIFPWLWAAWGGAFALIEGVALLKGDKPDTPRSLSSNLRAWFHTDSVAGRSIWALVGGVFFGWFIIHIATKPGSLF